jgi:hypothetical protein
MTTEFPKGSPEKKEDPICPSCGSMAVCKHEYNVQGTSPVQILDRFTLNCLDCSYTAVEVIDAWQSGHVDELSPCPFCGKIDD